MKKRNMVAQLAISVIPYLNIYGFYRIKKLRLGIILVVGLELTFLGLFVFMPFSGQIVFPVPYPLNYFIGAPMYLYFMYRWTLDYNMTASQTE